MVSVNTHTHPGSQSTDHVRKILEMLQHHLLTETAQSEVWHPGTIRQQAKRRLWHRRWVNSKFVKDTTSIRCSGAGRSLSFHALEAGHSTKVGLSAWEQIKGLMPTQCKGHLTHYCGLCVCEFSLSAYHNIHNGWQPFPPSVTGSGSDTGHGDQ